MIDLRQPMTWHDHLGMLPISLDGNDQSRFVMLNGVRGNFCLDFSGDSSRPQSTAWSVDVGHYLRVEGNYVDAYRWDQASPSRFSQSSVASQLERFQEYLETNEPSRELSVARHAVDLVNTLRSILGDGATGRDALRCFVVLLASVLSGEERSTIDWKSWGLMESDVELAASISKENWQALAEKLINPHRLNDVRLIPSVAIRHAAGQIFQEAHYAAIIRDINQLLIPGILPGPARVQKPQSRRADPLYGVYFTPPPIARTLVEQSLLRANLDARAPLVVFDPACGSGEFLSEVGRQLQQHGFRGNVKLIGWDDSSIAVAMARFTLHAQFKLSEHISVEIKKTDSLTAEWPDDVNILLMNPPFVSWWDMSNEQRVTVSNAASGLISAKPDYSAAFIVLASKAVGSEGVIGTVMPTSSLDSVSAHSVREYFANKFDVALVGRMGNLSLFHSAIVDAALVVGAPKQNIATTMMWSDQRAQSLSSGLKALRRFKGGVLDGDGYSIYETKLPPDVEWSPRPYAGIEILRERRHLPRVTDVFDVRQGTITGLNAAFVLSSDEYELLSAKEKAYFRPATMNRSILAGSIAKTDYVFYPYLNGKPIFKKEGAVKRALPVYFNTYLEPNRERLEKRRGMSDKWWELIWPRAERSEPKIVTTYYGRRGDFALDPGGMFVVVQGYSWYPRNELRRNMFGETLGFAYLALLNSAIFETALSGAARQVAGGQFDLSKRFLKNTPLPDLFTGSYDSDSVASLAALGRQLFLGEAIDYNYLDKMTASFFD